MDAGKHIVLVAIDQRDAMLDRGLERRPQIVRIDDGGQIAEARRQRDRFIPAQQLALLDDDPRIRKLRDRPHMIEMRVA